jgi:hypothetical protein
MSDGERSRDVLSGQGFRNDPGPTTEKFKKYF